MKLSFIIPAYNEEANIGRCLQSIEQQLRGTNFDVEVVVVNNASNDNTAAIARSFANVVVVDEPIKGLVQARQTGYVTSTGEILANVDADTILPNGWIKTVMEEFEKNPKLVALSGPFIYYDLSPLTNLAVRIFYYLGYVVYVFNRFVLKVGSLLQGGNFVVRRSALEKAGGFDTSISFYGEDTDIARRLHAVGEVKFTFKLPMYTSGRRIAAEGLLTMGAKYAINHFWITFFKKPYTHEYQDVRPKH